MMNKFKVLMKHLWLDASDTRRAIPPDLLQRLAERVAASERGHSGQIRICVEASLPASYLWRLNSKNTMGALIRQRAVTMFGKLGVWDTQHNNGVLIYVLLAEQAIEIVADRALTQHIGERQWQTMVASMAGAFRGKRYEEGLMHALEEISAVLMTHFALADSQESRITHLNELPDAPQLQ